MANLTTSSSTPAERYGALVRNALGSSPASAVIPALDCLKALPTPGSESWKYSPVNRLYEALELATPEPAPSKAEDVAELLPLVDTRRYPLAALTALSLTSVSRVQLKQGERHEAPPPAAGNHWLHIDVPANTSATLIQRATKTTGIALITTVNLGAGATLFHSLTGCENSGTRWQLLSVNQQENSDYRLHQLSLGGTLERLDTHIRLLGIAANTRLTGALLCGGKDRCDNQTVLEHAASRCTSSANYHGLAQDQGKLTFGGRIHILENGAGTDARLHNPNLLLSDKAEINTKPELEIYNDDVACAHGATVGQLDDDAVFYLRSRGIHAARAQALLLRGFVGAAIGGPDADYAQELTNQRLTAWTL